MNLHQIQETHGRIQSSGGPIKPETDKLLRAACRLGSRQSVTVIAFSCRSYNLSDAISSLRRVADLLNFLETIHDYAFTYDWNKRLNEDQIRMPAERASTNGDLDPWETRKLLDATHRLGSAESILVIALASRNHNYWAAGDFLRRTANSLENGTLTITALSAASPREAH